LDVPGETFTHSHPTFDLNAPETILFTSGSSGQPKAALHTFGNHYYSASGSNHNLPVMETTRWLLVLPLYHVGGLAILFRCFLHGGTVVMPTSHRQIAEAITDFQVTHVSLVATQLQRLLDIPFRADQLEAILLGGSAIPPQLLQTAHAAGWPVHVSYGSTEMASQISTTPPGAGLDTLFTAGYVLPHRAIRIARDGQIWVNGPTRFQGYVEGEHLRIPFDEQGWFATGDRGRFDADFRLHVEGRFDNMFISGGENIQPEEIETALRRLHGIVEAVVVPVPDPEFGFRPVAFIQSTDGGMKPEHWMRGLEDVLPRFKIPRVYHLWPDDIKRDMKIDRSIFQHRALN
jgi:O-succinylbenzoic acid--CoA ligase